MVAGGPKGIAWLARRKADEAGTEMGFRRATGDASKSRLQKTKGGEQRVGTAGSGCWERGARCEVWNAALMMLGEEEGDGRLKGTGCVEKSRRGQARLN